MKRPTIADIARRAGVSKGAVSYALNGRPGVSAGTRQRILAIAEEVGWQPNSAARALSGSMSNVVGLALCRPARVLGIEPFFMELISGLEAELSARDYGLTLQVVADADAELAVHRRWWAERRVDGVLVCDLRVDDPRVPALEELGLPAVVIGGPAHTGGLPSVWHDDAQPLAETVEYLAALGHRRIAHVAGLPELLHTRVRTEAFHDVTTRLALPEAVTVSSDYTGEAGARITRRLLSSPRRPTAVIYDNDVMAIAGLGVAQELRLDVPGDLSIVAWDDSPLCQLTHPALTALGRDIPAYGAIAAKRLLAAIAGEDVGDHRDVPAQLTTRGSTGAPR
ncbi:LacI family DNA-binding transcriptional regulator [Phytomonospora endophytica]|uniref:DNA-binding LacI/PurR family transcriptional regulator n=1 Tax=Phytomonospora endophytica TaxID=714109 RepID=A0A841FNW7_9ACTN|nr:LacI family DNA-binding transcriptional regulator [Phytomonospora endophytica]MBB6036563.1 DNA-binding LacI/PurR family transcriptional regulator [Phytomonospora endophytica]GIG65884.1 LacI family transcriptional regulator [Phytomonospora endophytica]